MNALPEFLQNHIKNIAENERFANYQVKIQPGAKYGDGFAGLMVSIQITEDQLLDGECVTKTLNLLCKTPPADKMRRQNFQTDMLFKREIHIYKNVLPEFRKFQLEKALLAEDSFCAYPKCYVAHADSEKDEYVLIMEDLRARHFQMWPKENPIALDHVQLFVKEMGKLHGISFALKDQRPELYNQLKSLNDLFSVTIKAKKVDSFLRATINRALKVLHDPNHIKLLKEVYQNILLLLDEWFGEDACEPFGVLGHGDPWNNNLLYQYDENGTNIRGICFVDWQIARYCSPVFDLLYNLFTNTDKRLRDNHFMDLLRLYHSSLSTIMQKLGSDPEKLFTFDDLMSQFRKFGRYAFLVAPLMIQFMVARTDDITRVDEYSENNEEFDLFKPYSTAVEQRYSVAVNNAISDIVAYGFVKISSENGK